MYTLEFEIPHLPKTPNQLLGAKWFMRSKHAKEWHVLVLNALLRHSHDVKPLSRARLTLTRCSSRRGDYDGIVGSFKAVIDALVKAQVLIDDTHEVIGVPTYLWEQTPKGMGKIKVKVEEI